MYGETREVADLYTGVKKALDIVCSNGRKVGDCKCGVYLFRDYDGEPIYVGQTYERLRNRIRRHLTNQRTDAVAMSVLDPFEVAEIEMWPLWELETNVSRIKIKELLNRAEYTVYRKAVKESEFNTILNENNIPETKSIKLPESVRANILPESARRDREHPDVRTARRARTIANLAKVISERKVKVGIRRTLWAQAKRLERLAHDRLQELCDKDE